MATVVVSIICIAMIIVGGITLSQGILTSADTAAFSVNNISIREGEYNRTSLDALRAARLSWANCLRLTVKNTGQTKLADFDKWDVIVHYYDDSGINHIKWLPYTGNSPVENEWQAARIGLNGPTDFFEPGILNPSEELIILAKTNPPTGNATTGNITISTVNGVYESISFSDPGYTLLVPHSENTTIAGTDYYELEEAAPADGTAITNTTDIFTAGETGRKMMHDEAEPSRLARYVFALTGINQVPADTWTVYYRCRTVNMGDISDNEVSFNIDILIRAADGTVRATIASGAAVAYLRNTEVNTWITKNAIYGFPGYTVADDNDYLEIAFYGELGGNGSDSDGYLQIRVDDDILNEADQTRIES
jgi:hypothetical protein